MRKELNEALKTALKSKDSRSVSTLRLILAAIKDRDIAVRSDGNAEGISDEQILDLLQKMIKQRHESIAAYEKGGRADLVAQEQGEIEVIRRFLPAQMSQSEIQAAVAEAVTETGAGSLKDMGKVMGVLKERYAGRMDMGAASGAAKKALGS
ncbi:MAG: GatB/YqeY domain-containing protein [Alphaproteobacteria bacterium]